MRALRCLLLLAAVGLSASGAGAQPDSLTHTQRDARAAVRATIDRLFDGMRAGDSAAVRAVFHDRARLYTARGPSDTSAVEETPIDAFVAAVGRPHERTWDERIWDVDIRVDGPLASAWVPYAFYRGDRLSHCGVNAVQLVRTGDGWKIMQLTDTRRSDCSIPPSVRK